MSFKDRFSRRQFIQATGIGVGYAVGSSAGILRAGETRRNTPANLDDERRLLKTLKFGMVQSGDSLVEKFQIVRDAGFDGIELDSPGVDIAKTLDAIARTGLPVDGTVCSTHWETRHSSPDTEVRAKALGDLKTAIRDTHAIGGSTALLVVGHGDDGTEEEVWSRSIENISKAIPLAANLGVYIAIENVWNKFLYDHDGGSDQTADKFVRYVDELNSPWVGMQFDIGNHWKYGSAGDWIRTLGKRVVKLDAKGYSRANQKWTPIGDGDIDWADVRAALKEINFSGWVAAEVGGGDEAYLKTVSGQLDKVFDL